MASSSSSSAAAAVNLDAWVREWVDGRGATLSGRPSRKSLGRLGKRFQNWAQRDVPGDGSCLVHSFLAAASPTFRRLSRDNQQVCGEAFRTTKLADAAANAHQKARITNTKRPGSLAEFLVEEDVELLCRLANLNAIVLAVGSSHVQGMHALNVKLPGRPWLTVLNTGNSHFDAVQPPGTAEDGSWLLTWQEGDLLHAVAQAELQAKQKGSVDVKCTFAINDYVEYRGETPALVYERRMGDKGTCVGAYIVALADDGYPLRKLQGAGGGSISSVSSVQSVNKGAASRIPQLEGDLNRRDGGVYQLFEPPSQARTRNSDPHLVPLADLYFSALRRGQRVTHAGAERTVLGFEWSDNVPRQCVRVTLGSAGSSAPITVPITQLQQQQQQQQPEVHASGRRSPSPSPKRRRASSPPRK